MAQIGDAETKKKFASLMNEQNIEIYTRGSVKFIFVTKIRRRIQRS
jgi:hypothetical protein